MSGRSVARVRRTLAGALSLVALASSAQAQQVAAPRFARPSAPAGAAPLVPDDSVAHYLRAAHAQRRTGGALVAVGLAAVAGAYVHSTRSGRMGMTGGQAATFAAGTVVGAVGATRWAASRASLAAAARWREARTVARP